MIEKFKNLSFKQKNLLLCAGAILFLFIAYQLSIEETFAKRKACAALNVKLNAANEAPGQIDNLTKELKLLEEQIGSSAAKTEDFQQNLLEHITRYCSNNKIDLVKFPAPLTVVQDQHKVETNYVVVEGKFLPILKLIHLFEHEYHLGKLISVDFDRRTDKRTRKNKLYATLYIQNIQKVDA